MYNLEWFSPGNERLTNKKNDSSDSEHWSSKTIQCNRKHNSWLISQQSEIVDFVWFCLNTMFWVVILQDYVQMWWNYNLSQWTFKPWVLFGHCIGLQTFWEKYFFTCNFSNFWVFLCFFCTVKFFFVSSLTKLSKSTNRFVICSHDFHFIRSNRFLIDLSILSFFQTPLSFKISDFFFSCYQK